MQKMQGSLKMISARQIHELIQLSDGVKFLKTRVGTPIKATCHLTIVFAKFCVGPC